MNIFEVLEKFQGVKKRNDNSYQCQCPAHEDGKASLTISEKDGKILLFCHAGCDVREIISAAGIEWDSLFEKGKSEKKKGGARLLDWIKTHSVRTYEYRDKDNNHYILIARTANKQFFQYTHIEGDKWQDGLNGKQPVLYRLPEIFQAIEEGKTIYIVEGEKDADNLWTIGLPATCNPMGAGKWREHYNEIFKGKGVDIVIIPDQDDPGRKHGNSIAFSLFSIAKSIKMICLPKKDVSDWLDAGGTKEELLEMVEKAEPVVKEAIETKIEEAKEISIVKKSRGKSKRKILLETENFLLSKYNFRINDITFKTEFKLVNSEEWKEVTDSITAGFYNDLTRSEINYSISDLRLLLQDPNFAPNFNPFNEYFDSLQPWDGIEYIKAFTDYFILADESERLCFEVFFKKWFVGILTGIYNRQWCNQVIFIITGEQGDGKTTILNKLIPPTLENYLQIGGLEFGDKDTKLAMCNKLLINIDELESFTKKNIDQLKSNVTAKNFDIRLPYGHCSQKIIKRCSFMASTNRNAFLSDPTGSRRFIIFEVDGVKYERKFDVDKMYSQAKHLYFNEFRYWFNKEEIDYINKRNEKFSTDSPEEQLLLQYFKPVAAAELCRSLPETILKQKGIFFLSTTGVANELMKETTNRIFINIKKLGGFLRKHGFKKVGKGSRHIWCVKLISVNSGDEFGYDEFDQEMPF